jgi:hypothetical protein
MLVIGEKVHGHKTATSKSQQLKPTVLLRNISAPSGSIEEGTFLNGSIDMGSHPVVDELQTAPLVTKKLPNG